MNRDHKRPHGQLRQSQLVGIFGPGAMLDLPDYAVLVAGLEHWSPGEEIYEPRLVELLEARLDRTRLRLQAPPIDDPGTPRSGVRVWEFPEWFVTQHAIESGTGRRSRRLVHLRELERRRFVHPDSGKKYSVVPVRFVRACPRGHIDDLDWDAYVHRGERRCGRPLWLDERGTSGDLLNVRVRCECGEERSMIEASEKSLRALGHCTGRLLWLGPGAVEACEHDSRLLSRSASHSYFPNIQRVISLPALVPLVTLAVRRVWQTIQEVQTAEVLAMLRSVVPSVREALEGFGDDEVLAAIQARRAGGAIAPRPVKEVEIEVLSAATDELGVDEPEGDFYARAVPRERWDAPWMAAVERVVLVHRLREVAAQAGFTRFEAEPPNTEGELDMDVQLAPLSAEADWLPAVENRGEGVFIGFRRADIEAWRELPAVQARQRRLAAGLEAWKADHPASHREFPDLAYIMLHSLSHLLLTAIALESGYPASSIRERVYAGAGGYGILLYTGSPDAEGTLGGLVQAGRRIQHHLRLALDSARLCSNDPVCAQHDPSDALDRRFMLGAACHGCLLIAETSCEMFNDFLDRSLVVPTVDEAEAAFFGQDA